MFGKIPVYTAVFGKIPGFMEILRKYPDLWKSLGNTGFMELPGFMETLGGCAIQMKPGELWPWSMLSHAGVRGSGGTVVGTRGMGGGHVVRCWWCPRGMGPGPCLSCMSEES